MTAAPERVSVACSDAARELRAPRYTSYPSALCFTPGIGEVQWRDAAMRSAGGARPLSLYLHLPFCASACFYCGCHRVVSRNASRKDAYLDALEREIDLQAGLFGRAREVVQIHLGGGTPNTYSPAQLTLLLDRIRHRFRVASALRLEVALEADPRSASVDDVRFWRRAGFNRVSFGVQDVSADTQRAINRVQSPAHIAALTQAALEAGFASVNYDLVYGLPRQTPDSIARTLDFVVAQRPDRVAAFHYAHLPQRFAAQRAIADADLPDLATRLTLRAMIAQRLQAAGYVAIGLDHFALPSDALAVALAEGRLNRNFQGYTPLSDVDIVGLGASSIGFAGGVYAQNEPDLARYQQAIAEGRLPIVRGYALSDDDRLRGEAIRDLMCGRGVSWRRLSLRHGERIAERLGDALARLRAMDPAGECVRLHEDGVDLLPAGRDRLRVLASAFDAHLDGIARAGLSRAA